MEKYAPRIYVVLRFVAGVMFALHGSQRLFGWPPGERAHEPLRIVASTIELVTGTLIATGVFASWAALVAAIAMLIGFAMRRQELLLLYSLLWFWVASKEAASRSRR